MSHYLNCLNPIDNSIRKPVCKNQFSFLCVDVFTHFFHIEIRRMDLINMLKEKPNDKVLDGFILLDACGVDFPEDGREAELSNSNFGSVIEEDILCFSKLEKLDASENSLQLSHFERLPKLLELRMVCNGLQELPLGQFPFPSLLYLDLSYNLLSPSSLPALVALPNLKHLDITGNNLRDLPIELASLSRLEVLIAEKNMFEEVELFQVFASFPSLRELDLSHNAFTFLANEDKFEFGLDIFPKLNTLDLAFNFISQENDLLPLIHLPKLARVMIFGNPLLGPTGEDPCQLYIENLLLECDDVRGTWGYVPLDFIGEYPKKKVVARVGQHNPKISKGVGMGRQAGYRDFSITCVDESNPFPTSYEYREMGNLIIDQQWQDEDSKREPLFPDIVQKQQLEDKEEIERTAPLSDDIKHEEEDDAVFMTALGVDVEEVVDTVKKSWEERIALVNETNPFSPSKHQTIQTSMNEIPHNLMKREFSINNSRNPNLLRSVIRSLRHRLDNPMTSDFAGEVDVQDQATYLHQTETSESNKYKNVSTSSKFKNEMENRRNKTRKLTPVKSMQKTFDKLEESLDALNFTTREAIDSNSTDHIETSLNSSKNMSNLASIIENTLED